MTEILADFFSNMPPQLATFLIAMVPIGELRASIPIGITIYELSVPTVFILSILGNLVPVIIILLLIHPITNFLSKRIRLFEKFTTWLFDFTHRRHRKKFNKWGKLALIILVAIPLPMTGGWTGALAAYVFGIPLKKSFPLIAIGVLIAGIIVTLVTTGAISIL